MNFMYKSVYCPSISNFAKFCIQSTLMAFFFLGFKEAKASDSRWLGE